MIRQWLVASAKGDDDDSDDDDVGDYEEVGEEARWTRRKTTELSRREAFVFKI